MGFEATLVVLLTLSTQSKKVETFTFSREIFTSSKPTFPKKPSPNQCFTINMIKYLLYKKG